MQQELNYVLKLPIQNDTLLQNNSEIKTTNSSKKYIFTTTYRSKISKLQQRF